MEIVGIKQVPDRFENHVTEIAGFSYLNMTVVCDLVFEESQ